MPDLFRVRKQGAQPWSVFFTVLGWLPLPRPRLIDRPAFKMKKLEGNSSRVGIQPLPDPMQGRSGRIGLSRFVPALPSVIEIYPLPATVTQPEALRSLLQSVAQGDISPEIALDKLRHFDFEPVEDFARIDHHRPLRTGFPEVIWGLGKTPEQMVKIFQAMRQQHPCVMATRITPEVFAELHAKLRELYYFPAARICATTPLPPEPRYPGTIGLISAGTADLPVAEEAAVTALLSGFRVQRFWDVGVAGIHRLLNQRRAIAEAEVLIVVAGMEGALASVVAGMVDAPVVAVPTSIGYGASFNGLAPLLTMLNSCATGIGVVNIDNGFGAAMLAGQILRTAQKF